MPLIISTSDKNETCVLSHWAVEAEVEFVSVLAWLYLRKPLHAERVIAGLEPGTLGIFGNVKDNVIKLLSCDFADIADDLSSADDKIREMAEKKRDARIAHRDGLLFQHVSWIAARLQFPTAEAAPPHVRKADKGFDGLLVDLDLEKLAVSRVVICEDKASISPRSLVTSKIWPDLKSIIAGERDAEVLDAITPLLRKLSDEDREIAIGRMIWERARQFRISLAAGNDQIQNKSY